MTATAQLTDQRKPGMTVSDVDKPVTLLEIYSASPKYSYTEKFQTVPHTIKHTHLKALYTHPQVPIRVICIHQNVDTQCSQ